jgi:hypothetical protein
MNFGKYAILSDVTHTFEKEPDWYWIIGAPTTQDELQVSKILTTDRTKMELDGTRVSQMPATLEIAMREIAVTFRGTNIPTSENDPAPILKKGASVAEVEDVLKQMPRAMIWEIWNAVGDAVHGWGPAKPRAKQVEKKDSSTDEAKN